MSTANPFAAIDARLGGVEELLNKVLDRLERPNASNATEIGGVDFAVALTGLSKNTIYALASKRAIPHSKPAGSNRLYFNRAELLAWVASGNREVAQEGRARG